MASIRRLLSLAANEVDEDAAFWSEVRIEALARELFSIGLESGIEVRLGFPVFDSIDSDVAKLC